MAIVSRASTFATFTNTLRNINMVQTSVFDAQNQLSSGLKTDNFSGLSGEVEQFVFLEARIKKVVAYQENNAVNLSRLETTKKSLQQMTEIVDQMENLMVLRRNEALENDIAFTQQLNSQIRSLASELNTTFEGKFLFAGTRTNVNPVIIDPQVPRSVTLGTPDDGYYQGSKEDVVLRADDNVDIRARVRADAEGFQDVFAAAFLALEAHELDDDQMITDAVDLVQVGLEKIISLEASVNADIIAITQISERQNSLQLYWQGVTEQVSKTDILGVSTKLALDQTVLQATFQAFAGINELRLADFLR